MPDSVDQNPAADSLFRFRRVGLASGLAWTAYNTLFNVIPLAGDCGQFEGHVGKEPVGEIFFETPLPFSSFLATSYLQFGAYRAEFNAPPHTHQALSPNGTVLVDVLRQFRYTIARPMLRFGLGAAWEPFEGIGLGLSPTVSILAGERHEQTENILKPLGATFPENNSDVRELRGATRVQFRRVAFGADVSLRGRASLGERIAAHAQLRGSMQFGSIASNVKWNENGLQILFGLSYDIAPRYVPIPRPPPPPPVLAAKITIKGVNEQGEQYDDPTIEIDEASRIEQVPVIPYIFFDSASANIPERYIRLAGPAEIARFSVDSLPDATALHIHWQLLNIIGQRMRSYPSVHLTITGLTSGDEPPEQADRIGTERARAIATYLRDVWDIAPDRISTAYVTNSPTASSEETPQGREENRRVEFYFSEEVMTAPVTIQRLTRIASPPAVVFFPEIIADTTVAEWYITVVQGERELVRFAGSSGQESFAQQKHWSLGELRVSPGLIPIRYVLSVRDMVGQMATAEGAFRLKERVRQRPDDGGGFEVKDFSLVGFKYNSSELLPRHQMQLQEIVRQIAPATEMSIIGYTDSVGTSERNRQLSQARAKGVFEALKVLRKRLGRDMPENTSVQGLGREGYDNRLPEGRLLSRMVRVALTREK